jgi:spermidine synthase
MRNLDLSKDASDFITALGKERAKPVWNRIAALLEGPSPGDISELGDGVFCAAVNEFLIMFKFDQAKVYVNHIATRDQIRQVAPGSTATDQPFLVPTVGNFKFEGPLFELFALSGAFVLFALTFNRWFILDLPVFGQSSISFPLIAFLAGAAIGILRKDIGFFKLVAPAFLVSVLMALGFKQLVLSGSLPQDCLQFVGFPTQAQAHSSFSALSVVPAILLLLFAPFTFSLSIASRIGSVLSDKDTLLHYGTAISAAIVAYLVFELSTIFCLAPAYQVTIVAIALIAAFGRELRTHIPLTLCLVLGAVAMFFFPAAEVLQQHKFYFSPYHKIDTAETNRSGVPLFGVLVDDSLRQVISLSENGNLPADAYHLPYPVKHPKDVLVLNAGIGTDVSEALSNGAEAIDAIELDPILFKLAKRFNPAYKMASVNASCEDPRTFLNICQKKYDMIIVSCLDLVRPANLAALRQNRQIRTIEAYKKCLSLLKPGGILHVSFASPSYLGSEWLRNSYYMTAKAAGGIAPVVISAKDQKREFAPYVFVIGQDAKSLSNLTADLTKEFSLVSMPEEVQGKIITDDNPSVSWDNQATNALQLVLSILLVSLVIWLWQPIIFAKSDMVVDWQLFLIGAGFASMVLGSIPRLTAIYGNSWFCDAILFGGILIISWLANYLIRQPGATKYEVILYVGLFVSLTVSYFLPVSWLLSLGLFGAVLVTFFTILPMFRVLLMLPAAYSEASSLASPFAFSLMGLSLGALLEMVSVNFGGNILVLLSLVLIAFSFLFYRRSRRRSSRPVVNLATKRIT